MTSHSSPTFSGNYVRTRLVDILTTARCGIHPWERHPERPTRLLINVDLYSELQRGQSTDTGYVDFNRIRDFIKTFPGREHADLLETLVDEIVAQCFADGRVVACCVSVLKPDVFEEAEGAGIEVFRTRDNWEK